MPRPLDDLTGRRFGQLRVLHRVLMADTRHTTWLVACKCGERSIARGSNLRAGCTRTCGHGSNNPTGRRGDRFVPC